MPGVGLAAIKGVILYGGVFLAFACWLLAQFVAGSITIPRGRVWLVLLVWVVLALVSALFSQNAGVSLWGRGFALDSFATVLVLGIFVFLIAMYSRDEKRLATFFVTAYTGIVAAVALQIIFYLVRNTSLGSHVFSVSSTLVGSWIDFAYFVTMALIFSLVVYEVLMPKRYLKYLAIIAIALSLLTLIFLNFKIGWIVATVTALLIFVYKSSIERSVGLFFRQSTDTPTENTQRFPLVAFGTLLVGLFFFLSSNSLGVTIARRAGIALGDVVRPNMATTLQVAGGALKHHPLFGIGAGRFGDAWNLYHPLAVNATALWNTSFEHGVGMIETMLVTNGPLVTLTFLVLCFYGIVVGVRLLRKAPTNRLSRFIALTATTMFTLFVVLLFFFTPSIVMLVFGFFWLAIILGLSMSGNTRTFEYLRDPRQSFFAILILIVAVLGSLTAAYKTSTRFSSVVWYNRALTAPDLTSAQVRLDHALRLSENDLFWRTRAALFVGGIAKADATSLQTYFTQAEESARRAILWDRTNAQNWLTLSEIYALAGDNATAATNALQAAHEAQIRSPLNPFYIFNQARAAFATHDTTAALGYLDQAIVLKADYLDAYVYRIGILQSIGDSNGAVAALHTLKSKFPNLTGIDEKIQELQTPPTPIVIEEKKPS